MPWLDHGPAGSTRETTPTGSGARQRFLDETGDGGHVGTAGQLRLQDGHDLAHVGRAGGAGRGDGGLDFGGNLVARKPLNLARKKPAPSEGLASL